MAGKEAKEENLQNPGKSLNDLQQSDGHRDEEKGKYLKNIHVWSKT